MKRLFALLLALCLTVGLLPMAAMAEAPAEVKVKFYNGTAPDFTLTIPAGDTAYVVENDAKELIKWTETDAPTDKFIKLELAESTLKVTMNNVNVDLTEAGGYTCHGIWFQAGDYGVDIDLVGTNSITHGNSACIKYENNGNNTITGAGSLEITQNGSAAGAIWSQGGDMTVKNTNLKFTINSGPSALHHAFYMAKGSITIEGTKIEALTMGGRLVYFGTTTAKTGRYTLDTDESRKLVIKDSEIVAKAGQTSLETASPATIINSTVKITLTGSSGPAIAPAPTIEGEYTAIAGLAKNAEKLDKLKEYSEKKLGSYTYVYIVPGKVDLLPTTEPTTEPTTAPTTEPTEAPTTEATEAPTTEATKPVEATKPTTADKNEATKPADKDDNKTDKGEETSGNPLKVILIILIALVVLGGGAVAVILILRNKNAAAEEGEEEEAEEETEAEAEEE